MTKQISIVGNGDDWEGLYVDGKLALQGHSLGRVQDVLEILGFDVLDRLTEEGWLEDIGYLPENMEDVKFEED